MSLSAPAQPPAAPLSSIAGLAAIDPKTLHHGRNAIMGIAALADSLRGTSLSDIGARIVLATEGDLKTLPQVKERLAAIAALIPSAPTTAKATAVNPFHAKIVAMRERAAKSAANGGTAETPDADAAIYDRYAGLKGSERQTFFSANRAALVREHTRRANAPTAEQSDVLAKYQALAGAERQAFYAAHERELWTAYRASLRAA